MKQLSQNIRKLALVAVLAISFGASASAQSLQEAQALMSSGNYSQAIEALKSIQKTGKSAAQVSYLIGQCYQQLGDMASARLSFENAQKRGNKEAIVSLAELAFDNYDFSKAKILITRYDAGLRNAAPSKLASQIRSKIFLAEEMISHVEKITIIDSLVVDKAEFFKAYRLAPQAGSLTSADVIPQDIRPEKCNVVFQPESKESMMWAQPDADGTLRLMQSSRLLDGTWDHPAQLDDMLNDEGDADYPFVTSDGQSLYYANNGANSIGGYDIFVTRKDPDTGQYLKPQNVGMPYNSPSDDYMLAIDDKTGIGWWATDRNHIPGKVTIYVYVPNEVRQNYNPDSVNVKSLAAIRSIKDTWQAGADYTALLSKIRSIGDHAQTKTAAFSFTVAKGVVYHSLSDAKTNEGRNNLEQYLAEVEKQQDDKRKLQALRWSYSKADDSHRKSMRTTIMQLEAAVAKSYETIDYYANQVRKAEQQK